MRLSRSVSGLRYQLESELNLNVEFQVPGHLLTPDFQGVRTGSFRKAERLLKIQVALPVNPPENPYAYGVQAIRDSIDEAEAWARRRRIEFAASPFRSLLALVEANRQAGADDGV